MGGGEKWVEGPVSPHIGVLVGLHLNKLTYMFFALPPFLAMNPLCFSFFPLFKTLVPPHISTDKNFLNLN